ncbi:flagellar assembly protein FliX [Roseomonas elaeocarpi]|uniref:Flagellar assembly protein FliX n=1 Tax=Roseomonas elaeocarpi TaxID=907779 RepID=A0ABV6JX58_9PROT
MHRIGDIRGAGPVAGGNRARRAAAGGFTLPEETTEAGTATAAAPLAAVGLLAIQEEPDDPAERDRQGRQRAAAMLEELQALQRELLSGRADPARLERLASLAEGRAASDPVLADALSAIALRARVEIARYEGRNNRR